MLWRRRKRVPQEHVYRDVFLLFEQAVEALKALRASTANLTKEELLSRIATLEPGWIVNPILPNIALILSEIAEAAENIEGAIRRLVEVMDAYVIEYPRLVVERCSSYLKERGLKNVTVIGYNDVIARCIVVVDSILSVHVLEARPPGDGLEMMRFLKSNNVKVHLVPDYAIQQAVENSDVVLFTLDSVTYDGWVLARPPSRVLSLAGLENGVNLVGITIPPAFQASLSFYVAKRVPSANIFIKEINDYININLYDLFELNLISDVVVRDKVVPPSELDVEGEFYAFAEEVIASVTGSEGG